ncbi:MAG TPA: DUF4229 domain-containing protein [Streptosporangiaceae bacterium]
MRSTLAYSTSRILLFVVSVILLHVIGIGGLLLWALAFVISMLVSYVLLSKQRDAMSAALAGRLAMRRKRGPGLRARLEEGTRMEDERGAPANEGPANEGPAHEGPAHEGPAHEEPANEGLQAAERGAGPARRA